MRLDPTKVVASEPKLTGPNCAVSVTDLLTDTASEKLPNMPEPSSPLMTTLPPVATADMAALTLEKAVEPTVAGWLPAVLRSASGIRVPFASPAQRVSA